MSDNNDHIETRAADGETRHKHTSEPNFKSVEADSATVNNTFTDPAGVEHSGELADINDTAGSIAVEDDGSTILQDVSSVNFGTDATVTDDGDGTVTVDVSGGSGSDTRTNVSESGSQVVANVEDINFTQSSAATITVTDDSDGSVTVDVAATDTHTDIEDGGTAVLSDVSSINFGSNVTVTDDGDGSVTVDAESSTDTRIDVSDGGSLVVSEPSDVNFAPNLSVTDDGDGTVTVDLANSISVEQVVFNDTGTTPAGDGEFRLNGTDVEVGTGGGVKNLSDIGTGGSAAASSTYPFTQEYHLGLYGSITPNTAYESECHLIKLTDNDLINIYRTGSSHESNDGKLVYQKSGDGGETWGPQTTIIDNGSYDDRNQSVYYYPPDERIVVFYREWDAAGSTTIDTLKIVSEDNGSTWGSPTSIDTALSATSGSAVPYGDAIRTDNGVMSLFYTADGTVEALFSTDNGQTWGNATTVCDTSGTAGRQTVEPVPVSLNGSDLIILGREDDTPEYFGITSTDGGSTWGALSYFDPFGGNTANGDPLWAEMTGSDELTIGYASRETSDVGFQQTRPELIHADPTELADEYVHILDTLSTPSDAGYPHILTVGPEQNHIIMTWYDNGGNNVITSFNHKKPPWTRTADPGTLSALDEGDSWIREDL